VLAVRTDSTDLDKEGLPGGNDEIGFHSCGRATKPGGHCTGPVSTLGADCEDVDYLDASGTV
jgi:hypothetical protein